MRQSFAAFIAITVLAVGLSNSPTAQATLTTVAADNASNYGAWSGNGGFGFDAWAFANFQDAGFAGAFLANTTANPDLNYIWTNPGFQAWGTFANGSGVQRSVAFRGFGFNGTGWTNALNNAGDVFKVSVENGNIQSGGAAGFVLRNGNNNLVYSDYNSNAKFEFTFQGGAGDYSYFDSTGQHTTDIPFTTDGLNVVFTLTGPNTFSFNAFNANGGAQVGSTFTGTLEGPANQTIDSVALYNLDTELANVYFNSLQIQDFTIPEPTTVLLCLAGGAILFLRSRRSAE